MARKLTPKQLEELTFLKDWNLTIIDFYMLKYPSVKEIYLENPEFKESLNQANLRGMRMAFNDFNEWAGDLPLSELNELNLILTKKFGCDLTKYDRKNINKIKRIVKRGHINNEEEYRLVLSRVEEIYADDSKNDEVETLNRLLAGFEVPKTE